MQQTLEETLARFDDVQAQTATIEEEVVDEVCLFTQAPTSECMGQICKACCAPCLPTQYPLVQMSVRCGQQLIHLQVRMRLGFLRERLVDHVVAVLDSAAGSSERAAPTGHWRAVFDKVTASPGTA